MTVNDNEHGRTLQECPIPKTPFLTEHGNVVNSLTYNAYRHRAWLESNINAHALA